MCVEINIKLEIRNQGRNREILYTISEPSSILNSALQCHFIIECTIKIANSNFHAHMVD